MINEAIMDELFDKLKQIIYGKMPAEANITSTYNMGWEAGWKACINRVKEAIDNSNHSYFPLLIKLTKTGEKCVIRTQNEIPLGQEFQVLQACFSKPMEIPNPGPDVCNTGRGHVINPL